MTETHAVNALKNRIAVMTKAASKTISRVNEVMHAICGSVLVLDNDEAVLQSITDAIAKKAWKLDIQYAPDIVLATTILNSFDIRVALVDFGTVKNNTKNFCSMLKSKRIPIIIMTGFPTTDVLNFCKSEHIRLIVKPFKSDELYSLLQESLIESALNRKTEAL